jgi:hypothetical protein
MDTQIDRVEMTVHGVVRDDHAAVPFRVTFSGRGAVDASLFFPDGVDEEALYLPMLHAAVMAAWKARPKKATAARGAD